MAEYIIQGETLENLADAIRSVASVSSTWTPEQMAEYILANLVKPTARQGAKTWTPGTSDQSIAAGTYLSGKQTIKGDANLIAANIKEGVSIFGKTGTLSGLMGDPSQYKVSFTAVASGTITPASITTAATVITHNLGVVPKLILMIKTGSGYTTSGSNYGLYCSYLYHPSTSTTCHYTVLNTKQNSIVQSEHGIYGGGYGFCVFAHTNNYTWKIPAKTLSDATNFNPGLENGYQIFRANASTFTVDACLVNTSYQWLVMG
ncbi:MAG: hypothetical protein J6S14_08880 [Clostridia bacterium]|nr:hypothetical protein [Clostridia bacterium]